MDFLDETYQNNTERFTKVLTSRIQSLNEYFDQVLYDRKSIVKYFLDNIETYFKRVFESNEIVHKITVRR